MRKGVALSIEGLALRGGLRARQPRRELPYRYRTQAQVTINSMRRERCRTQAQFPINSIRRERCRTQALFTINSMRRERYRTQAQFTINSTRRELILGSQGTKRLMLRHNSLNSRPLRRRGSPAVQDATAPGELVFLPQGNLV